MEEEFRRLERDKSWSKYYLNLKLKSREWAHDEADKQHNTGLNRYTNVKAYDKSRIKLMRSTDTDYINANEVCVPKAGRRYILTQGPLNVTLAHFWLMIWEQNSTVIVMLNKLVEMEEYAKCEQYWPSQVGDQITFEDVKLNVILKSIENTKHYIVRELCIKDLVSNSTRTVLQYHYMAWPDHGEPETPVSFLRLLASVRKSGGLDNMDKPAVVHCSAGIGRSGTFCLIDSILAIIETQGSIDDIDIGATILDMRNYRWGLIQSDVQLRFAYMSIIYGIKALEKSHKLRPHSSNKQRQQTTNGSPMNGSRRTSQSKQRKKSNGNQSAKSSLLVDALYDADSDTLDEAFDVSMTDSPTLKKQRSDDNNDQNNITNNQGTHSLLHSPENLSPDLESILSTINANGKLHDLSPIDLDKIFSDQISTNSIKYVSLSSSLNSNSDPKASTVLSRRREREQKLTEKTNEIKKKMKIEELKKEARLNRVSLLKKSAFYGSIVVALSSIVYMFLQNSRS